MTTTRVDFYQLSRDPVDVTVAKLARKVLQAGERLVVVSGDDAQRTHLSQVLWQQGGAAFLANGMAGGAHEARQPRRTLTNRWQAMRSQSCTNIVSGNRGLKKAMPVQTPRT